MRQLDPKNHRFPWSSFSQSPSFFQRFHRRIRQPVPLRGIAIAMIRLTLGDLWPLQLKVGISWDHADQPIPKQDLFWRRNFCCFNQVLHPLLRGEMYTSAGAPASIFLANARRNRN